jgi:primosomal protein N' (replication factor Y) (superfamily II helicase)
VYSAPVQTVRVADVAIDSRSGGRAALYTYKVEGHAEPGDALFVPLGTRSVLGFAMAVYDADPGALGFPIESLKSVQGRLVGFGLPLPVIEMVRFVAEEYLCPLPVALSAATPPGIRERLVKSWNAVESPLAQEEKPLTPMQSEVYRAVCEGGLIESKGKPLPSGTVRALRLLRGKGLVEQSLRLMPVGERRAAQKLLQLTGQDDRLETFLHEEAKRRPAQALTIMRLQTTERSRFTAPEIKAMCGVTDTTIKTLVAAGLLEEVSEEEETLASPPQPNPYQQLAIDAVVESVAKREYRPFLLYGVTGSGKTEVYLRAAAEALRAGRQMLYVVPEIALAAQAIARLRERFGRSVAVLHSELSPNERLGTHLKIRQGEVSIVLGARSALFAPLENLGLIVLDEEHETSFKQESAPRYHAKRVATFLAQRHGCPLVLGSATPSVESFAEAEQERLTLLSLPERAAKARLPDVHVLDLAEGYRTGQPAILTHDLRARMEATLAAGAQIILFLNRRAYAPFLMCRDCGQQTTCPRCAVSLSYHRRDGRLRCHHCGFQSRPPEVCPQCNGIRIKPFGMGTEKVEEEVTTAFPDARVARLDRDIAKKKGALEKTLALFRTGEIQILVGTQMVAKGLDFPNVTLVGVIAADMSLNIPDFRSSERTFQLLSQVAGRAGRGAFHGQVLIQTFNPQNVAIKSAQEHDFLQFYEALREERRMAGYPPFRRLVNVLLAGEDRAAVVQASQEAGRLLRGVVPPVEVLGPADCPLERLQNRWRRHLLVKMEPERSAKAVGAALAGLEVKGMQLVLDVDPYSLM